MDNEKVTAQVVVQSYDTMNKNKRVYSLNNVQEAIRKQQLATIYDKFINQDMTLIYDNHTPRPTECRFGSLLNPDPKQEKIQDILKNFTSQLKEYDKLFSDDNKI